MNPSIWNQLEKLDPKIFQNYIHRQQDFRERRIDNLLDQLPYQYLLRDLISPYFPPKFYEEYTDKLSEFGPLWVDLKSYKEK